VGGSEPVPWIRDAERVRCDEIADGFRRAVTRFGFMERPDIPALLHRAQATGCGIEPTGATYFVGHKRLNIFSWQTARRLALSRRFGESPHTTFDRRRGRW